MEYAYLQSLVYMAIDCVIFNDKLAGTTSTSTRNVLIGKYQFYFYQLICNSDNIPKLIFLVEKIFHHLMAQDIYSNHKFLILQCKKSWLQTNNHDPLLNKVS